MFYHLFAPETQESLQLFKFITFRAFMSLLTALAIYLALGKVFIRFLINHEIGQFIREEGPQHHQAKKGTPTMGGVLIVFSTLVSTLLWGNLSNAFLWLCLTALVGFGLLGFLDDYLKVVKKNNAGLRGIYKLGGQIFLSLGIGFFLLQVLNFNSDLYFPFFKNFKIHLGWFYLAFMVIVMVGASNAVNLTDGLDGLAAGPAISSFITYAIFAYVAGNFKIADYLQINWISGLGEVTLFCTAVAGAVVGFLWFNSYPAQVFMGDVGSLSLGGSLGLVGILTKQEILLIVIGGIFVVEALSVISQVASFKLRGKRIFKMAPLHHHFELKGWAESKVIVRFWIISFVLALLSLTTLKVR